MSGIFNGVTDYFSDVVFRFCFGVKINGSKKEICKR